MIITRDDVLYALATEPLTYGVFASDFDDDTCTVCAVGATLRKVGIPTDEIHGLGYRVTRRICAASDASVPRLLSDGLYMSALSVEWERRCEIQWDANDCEPLSFDQIDAIRGEMIVWVANNFPSGTLCEFER